VAGTVCVGDAATRGGEATADIADADIIGCCALSWASSDTVLSNSVRAKALQRERTPRPYRDTQLGGSPSIRDGGDDGTLLASLADECCVWFDWSLSKRAMQTPRIQVATGWSAFGDATVLLSSYKSMAALQTANPFRMTASTAALSVLHARTTRLPRSGSGSTGRTAGCGS
jgi:hypothetical protein